MPPKKTIRMDTMKNNNNDLQQAKNLNAQSKQGMTNSAGSNSTGYDSPDTQEARQFNNQSTQGGFTNSTVSYSGNVNPLDEAKKANKKSGQNKGK